MLRRKIERELERFLHNEKRKALLITGARQVGKTNSIRAFGSNHFRSFIELNLLENKAARKLLENTSGSKTFCFACLWWQTES